MPKGERDASLQEAKLLAALHHPNIVACVESFTERGRLCIVQDYCAGGDLYQRLKAQRGVLLPERRVIEWFTQILLGLKHVHDRKVLHRDLKTQNVFVTARDGLTLGDFGVSKVLAGTHQLASTAVGTPYYLSPEICENKPYDHKSDVWSAGCVLYEMCALTHPFDGASLKLLICKILRGAYKPLDAAKYGRELRDTVKEMLSKDPGKRPSVNELLSRQPFKAVAKRLLDEDVHAEEFSHTVIHSKKKRSPKTTDGSAFSSASASPTRRADRTEPPRRADLPSRTAAASPKTSPKASPQKPSPARAPLTAAKRARYPSVAYPPAAPLPRGRGGDRVGSPENRPNNVNNFPPQTRDLPPRQRPNPPNVPARVVASAAVPSRVDRLARRELAIPLRPASRERDVLEAKALRARDVAERERRRDALRAEADARRQKARDDARREFKARQAQARANRRACRPDGDGDADANVAKKNPLVEVEIFAPPPPVAPSRFDRGPSPVDRALHRERDHRASPDPFAPRGDPAPLPLAPDWEARRAAYAETRAAAARNRARAEAEARGDVHAGHRITPDHPGAPRITQDHPGAPRTPEHRAFGNRFERPSNEPTRLADAGCALTEAYEARARSPPRGTDGAAKIAISDAARREAYASGKAQAARNRARATEDAKGLIGDERSGLIGEVALAEGGAKLLIEALGSGEYGALGASTAPPDGFVAAQIVAAGADALEKQKNEASGGTRGSNPRSETTYSGATSEGTSSDERGSSEVDDVLAYSKFRLHDGATLCLPELAPDAALRTRAEGLRAFLARELGRAKFDAAYAALDGLDGAGPEGDGEEAEAAAERLCAALGEDVRYLGLVHQLIVCKDRLAMERDEPSLVNDGEGKEAGKRGLASGSVPVSVA